jgi:DNA repair protein RadD
LTKNLFSTESKRLEPWPFQAEAISDIVAYRNSYDGKQLAGVLVAPTGTGKSLIIAHSVYELAEPVLVIQPSVELLEQNYEKYIDHGGMASIYSASAGAKHLSSCTFATPGSIKGKGDLFRRILKVKVLFIDECHYKVKTEKDKGKEDEWGEVMSFINDMQPEVIIGLTATPIRLNTSNMGPTLNMITRTKHKLFHDIIKVIQIQDIYDKYWKKLRYQMYDFDESLLKLNSGGTEYQEESIKLAVESNNVNRKICLDIIKKVNEEGIKSILVFMDTVENSKKLCDWLNSIGISSAAIDGKTNKNTRKTHVTAFKAGEITVLINYGTFTTGFDYKALECVMMGRPTNSFPMLYQIIGRLVRIHDIIKEGLFIDYCNNIKRIGYINNITFENFPGYGWGMFNGDRLLSGRPLNMKPLYKKDLAIRAAEKVKGPYTVVHFGKHKGELMKDVPTSYLHYCVETFQQPDGILMEKFMDCVFEELEKREEKYA